MARFSSKMSDIDGDWTNTFFSQQPPDWVNTIHGDQTAFKPFYLDKKKWILWKSVDTMRRISPDHSQVLWVVIKYHQKYHRLHVAKVFPDYTEADARSQLLRVPFPRDPKEVRDELDPFLNEARVYRRIEELCENSQKIYFPRFHGVVTDIDQSNFESGYFNRRAVILEAIKPDLASRRILAANSHDTDDEHVARFNQQLRDIEPTLSSFESEYYSSLCTDRIRRLKTLHDFGITHGDNTGDFYDTVLYDFSISYTSSPVRPYLMNFKRPRSLKEISKNEQRFVAEQVYDRAKTLDFRDHLVASTGATLETIKDALFRPIQSEALELIIFAVMKRPDAFTMPSVNSVFPFLAALCPQGDSTWHIRRGRLLDSYDSIWVFSGRTTDIQNPVTLLSVSNSVLPDNVELSEKEKGHYLLCLVPKEWDIEKIRDQLLRICSTSKLGKNNWGRIISLTEFDNYEIMQENK